MPPLELLQRRFQAAITRPPGAEREEAVALASPLVVERGGLSAADRLGIYAGMFPLRMREALASDYPAVEHLLGQDAFERLVRDYVAAHPSASFTLARLGDHLPGFVAGWGPTRLRPLLRDVARLEHAAARVFEAPSSQRPGDPPFPSGDGLGWERTRFAASPDAALLRVCPGAVDALDACLDGSPAPRTPGRGSRRVLYHRKEFTVLRRTLAPKAGRLLEHLFAGEPLGEVLGHAKRVSVDEVREWFSGWTELGVLVRRSPVTSARRGTRATRRTPVAPPCTRAGERPA